MVISQKMVLLLNLINNINGVCSSRTLEVKTRKMDNRGSKLIVTLNSTIIKEQRVDDSWLLNFSIFNNLRYTLRRFERITSHRFISYQILNKRLYFTEAKESKNINSFIHKDSFSLNPWFITGFTDGDGSFSVSITKKKEGIGWKISPMFTFGLDVKDLDLLVQIKDLFNTGNISTSERGISYYTVGSVKEYSKIYYTSFR